jgi:hypothetical protein
MTKEEKAAEMARRKEERKQVCAGFLRQLSVVDIADIAVCALVFRGSRS